jgi:hypothetical protein
VAAGSLSTEAAAIEQDRLLDTYRERWRTALLCRGEDDLRGSLLREAATYYGAADLNEVERRFRAAVATLRHAWHETVDPGRPASIGGFYESAAMIDDLMEWHSLRDDNGPLAYVVGLDIAQAHGVRAGLDFGSGVGSGALLFTQAGITMTLADISTTLLDFARWRYATRGLSADFIDLKRAALPSAAFDMILAMDVFEHLPDPVGTVERLWQALRPGGLLFARIHAEEDASRPQHIVRDFGPTLARTRELGLVQTWQDTWLWGHRLFEKRAG